MTPTDLGNPEIHYVSDARDADALLDWLRGECARGEPLACDTETWGLPWWTKDFVRLIQWGNGREGWAVGVREWRRLAEEACRIVADARIPVIFHNAPFDMHALEDDGFAVPSWDRVEDTKTLHHLLFPHYNHSLKPMSEAKWGPGAVVGDKLMKLRATELGCKWWELPTDEPTYWAYGVLDTILTRRHWDDLHPQVMAAYRPQYEREMAAQAIMFRAERRGLRIDREYTSRLRDEWTVEAAALKAQLEAAGIQNPLSNRQVEATLRELEWVPEEFTDTGQAKLDKVILAQLAMHPEYGKVAVPLFRYKRLIKWMSVYLDHFLDSADSDGYVHASINSLQARTGRMSITTPPLQTLPSGEASIRTCVLPAREGERLWSVDYNSQEAVLFVNDAQDWGLAQEILNGEDLYTVFARAIYGDPSIQKEDDRRSMIKVMVLAMMYGAGVPKLALISGLPEQEVTEILSRLFLAFPSLPFLTGDRAVGGRAPGLFAEKAQERLLEEGLAYILTTGGRRFSMEPDGLFKSVNGRMQGSGADCLKDAIVRLDAAGYGDNIVIPVHDELVFSFPNDEDGALAAKESAEIMCDRSFYVPLTTDLSGPYDNWGQKYA